MSTVKATNFSHPSAANPAIVLDAAGGATVAGMGLVLVSPTSIANSGGSASASGGAVTATGVSSVSLNGVFTSTYQNYRVIATGVGSTSTFINLRMRVAGADETGSNYTRQNVNGTGTTVSAFRETTTSFRTIVRGSTTSFSGIFDILRPFEAAATGIINQGSTDGLDTDISHGNHSLSTSYDGFSLTTNAGTFTGIIRVYGYKNS